MVTVSQFRFLSQRQQVPEMQHAASVAFREPAAVSVPACQSFLDLRVEQCVPGLRSQPESGLHGLRCPCFDHAGKQSGLVSKNSRDLSLSPQIQLAEVTISRASVQSSASSGVVSLRIRKPICSAVELGTDPIQTVFHRCEVV